MPTTADPARDRLADWVALVDRSYPERDAEGWDAVGLHVGHPDDAVTRVLVALDVTHATLDEAAEVGADLLLVHHPLLFRPLARLTPATASGALALRAARLGVAVLAAHTNLDAALPGTTDPIVEALELKDVSPLVPGPGAARVKLAVFTPQEATDAVLTAMASAGAGVIGEYEECSFRVAGTGTFRPSAAANPSAGEREVRNAVAEHRLEVELPLALLGRVRAAMVAAHPYEEVAHDVYPLLGDAPTGKGIGRVGRLPERLPLRAVADRLATGLPSPHLRLAGDPDRVVERVAACGGAGDSLIEAALRADAEVYVTGDLRHHVTLDALTMGLALIDAGHHATEAPALRAALERLEQQARVDGLRAALLPSAVSTEPWSAYRPPSAEGEA
jgi:dinuclear metal center YbgI/SA1388 family protein